MTERLKQLLTPEERRIFRRLSSPERIQDYLDNLTMNFANDYQSPRRVLQSGKAQCLEGALLAAAALWYHEHAPLLLDLQTTPQDDDHVVALFQRHGYWGALSKTNHAVLRYREPVYRTIRELAMSYFHEYFDDHGRKNLRNFSQPFSLATYDKGRWIIATQNLDTLVDDLDTSPHETILTPVMQRQLRKADAIEIAAGKIVEWPRRKGVSLRRRLLWLVKKLAVRYTKDVCYINFETSVWVTKKPKSISPCSSSARHRCLISLPRPVSTAPRLMSK